MNRKTFPPRFGFYVILTNPIVGYEKAADLLVAAGAPVIQLRMKDTQEKEVLRTARRLRSITSGTGTLFIVNDYPHVAAAVGADGLHLGQTDCSYEEARRIVGPDALIGLSTHSPAQTLNACAHEPDYIGIGPVYPTPTKKNPDPAVGIDGMQAMLNQATVPAVVLGSITTTVLPALFAAGACNFSMVRPLCQSPAPADVFLTAQSLWKQRFFPDSSR